MVRCPRIREVNVFEGYSWLGPYIDSRMCATRYEKRSVCIYLGEIWCIAF